MTTESNFQTQLEEVVKTISNGFVLIVDDNPEVHRTLCRLLSITGIKNIKTSSDASEAISILDSIPISLMICDYHLGGYTAIDMHKELRTRSYYSNVPFLVITSDLSKDELMLAKNEGIQLYILKPFSIDSIQEKLVDAFDDFNS